mmetsp:Transcript_132646/g.383500  ORF Transcript_132646/g.383500 Transcript_132646/m.383500 type:complete len:332 (+) Transcript_132646:129-1124(+)
MAEAAVVGRPECAQAEAPAVRTSLSRSASNLVRVVPPQPPTATRQDLMERGMSSREADATLVSQAEQQVIAEQFLRFLMCFTCLMVLVSCTLFALWIWLIVAYADSTEEADGVDCNVPLRLWVQVVISVSLIKSFCKGLIDRCLCCWTETPEHPTPPTRVRLKDAFILSFEFLWVIVVGFYWMFGLGRGAGSKPTCQEVMPNLFLAARVYVGFNTAANIFFWLSAVGLLTVLRFLLRRGMLSSSSGAPPDAIDKNTEEISPGSAELAGLDSCPICIADFSEKDNPAVKLKTCGHIFHKSCLKNWLKVARTCPLCREDVVQGGSARPTMAHE